MTCVAGLLYLLGWVLANIYAHEAGTDVLSPRVALVNLIWPLAVISALIRVALDKIDIRKIR